MLRGEKMPLGICDDTAEGDDDAGAGGGGGDEEVDGDNEHNGIKRDESVVAEVVVAR